MSEDSKNRRPRLFRVERGMQGLENALNTHWAGCVWRSLYTSAILLFWGSYRICFWVPAAGRSWVCGGPGFLAHRWRVCRCLERETPRPRRFMVFGSQCRTFFRLNTPIAHEHCLVSFSQDSGSPRRRLALWPNHPGLLKADQLARLPSHPWSRAGVAMCLGLSTPQVYAMKVPTLSKPPSTHHSTP